MVSSYIHMGGKVGVLVEVNCESDFVARTDDFQALVKEIAMQIAAADPQYVSREQVPAEALEKEKEISRAQFAGSEQARQGDREDRRGQAGRLLRAGRASSTSPRSATAPSRCHQMVAAAVAQTGENITVSRFARFKLGELAE